MGPRILVKGASGAGKSTLARRLARQLDVPHIELDALHWGPGWSPATADELRARVVPLLDDERGWVIDGNYDSKLGTLLHDRASLIVWLDLPLPLKLWRLVRRTRHRLLPGTILWNGNRETLRGALWGGEALFTWAVRQHFRHRRKWPRELSGRAHVRLRSAREVEAWLLAQSGAWPSAPGRCTPSAMKTHYFTATSLDGFIATDVADRTASTSRYAESKLRPYPRHRV